MRGPGGEDRRVTAPLLSWRIMLVLFGILALLVVAETFIVDAYLDRIPSLIGTLVYFVVDASLLLAVGVGLWWRYLVGRPLKRLARAARRVASGDFSLQVEPVHKAGRRNELDVLIDDFNTMTRELAGNEVLKSDFLAGVSHEIKTPIAVIQSYTKALQAPDLPPETRRDYTATVLQAAQRLNTMITNILKLNKLEHQEIYPQPAAFPLGEQLRRCALVYLEKWEEKGIAFSIDVEDVTVCCDGDLLALVWENLLSNAVKFTPAGGTISLTARQEGDTVVVRLRDSGPGMTPEVQARIFETFYQGDPARAQEGNGLGLALVRRALEVVGGEISVESAPGQGTLFTVGLPL